MLVGFLLFNIHGGVLANCSFFGPRCIYVRISSTDCIGGSRCILTHVILPNVHALTANLDGDIDAVVDQERHSMALGKLVQLLGDDDDVLFGAVLVAILDDGYAASQRGLDHADEVFVSQDGGRGVGDEVDGVIYCHFLVHAARTGQQEVGLWRGRGCVGD